MALPLAVGGLSALVTREGMKAFELVDKPPLTPPQTVFPIAWSILYAMMGGASYQILRSDAPQEKKNAALGFYAAQLVFNFFWSLLFFNEQKYLLAFVWLCALWLLIAVTMKKFSDIRSSAGWLLLPYLLWVSFAGYLNYGVYLLN